MTPTVSSRRAVLKSLAAATGAGLLAACGVAAPPAQPAATRPASTPAATTVAVAQTPAQPRGGGSLRVGILGDIPSLDPHQLTVPVPDVTYGIWDRLLAYDPQLKPQPVLAEAFDMSSDGKQPVFRSARPRRHNRPSIRTTAPW